MKSFSKERSVPSAHITVQKNRVKSYGNGKTNITIFSEIYLNNGQEFELELDNPTLDTFVARIEMNGKSLGEGVVLRPGERIYLERYLDVARRFRFDTYFVPGENEEFTSENGKVEIKFYREILPVYTQYSPTMYITSSFYPSLDAHWTGPVDWSNTYYSSTTLSCNSTPRSVASTATRAALETGRVEQGGASNQKFTDACVNVSSSPTNTVLIKLLPVSRLTATGGATLTWGVDQLKVKRRTVKDIRTYCVECGRKQKHKWKYCPGCGRRN